MNTLWKEQFAERYAKAKRQEDIWRELAFCDTDRLVCGEPVRPLTPQDIVLLQQLGSPFVYPTLEVEPAHILQFLWLLHTANRGSIFRRYYRRNRFIRRMARRKFGPEPYEKMLQECRQFLREMYLDAPASRKGDQETKPLGVNWVASLMVAVGRVLGPTDPLTGQSLGEAPLPRLLQYHKVIRARDEGDKFKDFSPSDAIVSEWMEATNRQTHPGN